jgi:hypothetical protein
MGLRSGLRPRVLYFSLTSGLKDFIYVKKISEPIKSEIEEYLADALDEVFG